MVLKHIYSAMILLLLLSSCLKSTKKEAEISTASFQWEQSYLGGGGFITGLVQHPTNAEIVFARCDVAGLFKSDNGGQSWRLVNKGLQQGYNQNTESVCISPHNPNIMFRGSGEARNHQIVGEIHKSIDGGESWYSVSREVDFFGNGPNRMMGERIAVDPFNENFVAAGGFTTGVYISFDAGETWQYSGLKNEPISHLIFHPHQPNVLYVAALRDMRMKEYLRLNQNWNRPFSGRLFRSTDQGKTWQMIWEGKEIEFTEIAFFPDNHDKIIAATGQHGLMISMDGGHTFSFSNKGLPLGKGYNTVSVDQIKPEVIYTVFDRRGEDIHVPRVPIYKSIDGGESWNLLKDYNFDDFSNYPSYIKRMDYIGWAISKLMIDVKNPQRLFMSNWYGVSVSNDGGNTWNGHHFKGTETVCIENLTVDQVVEGRSGFVMPDHRPFIGYDFGASYQQILNSTEYGNSTVILFSKHNPNIVLFAGKRDWMGEEGAAILLSRDGGNSFGVVKEFTDLLTVQAIKEDPVQAGTFYAYIDRFLDRGAGLYRSSDWGETWTRLNLDLPNHIKSLPHYMDFIENELLSVTYGQQKNVCGTNQLLCIDPHRKGTIYFGEWTEGLFRTTNEGETWENIGVNLPFKRDTASVLIDIKADENVPGLIYAGFIREGLWRSKDYGDSWEKLFPADDRIFNASSIAVGGYSENELLVASEPLYWSPSESAVYYSNDAGNSWTNIYDNRYGALRWKAIGIDRTRGTIYGVTCGNGAFYANRLNVNE